MVSRIEKGDTVTLVNCGEGYDGKVGVVVIDYKNGAYKVSLDGMNLRAKVGRSQMRKD